jgi:hypothetical protein
MGRSACWFEFLFWHLHVGRFGIWKGVPNPIQPTAFDPEVSPIFDHFTDDGDGSISEFDFVPDTESRR